MVKRILLLLIALAVGGAPVAVEACQIVCASSAHARVTHTMSHADEGGGQSCHGDVSAPGPQFSHLPHACGHHDEQQPSGPLISASQTRTTPGALAVVCGLSVAFVAPPPGPFLSPPLWRGVAIPTSIRSVILRI
jgi:hypothetical protein